MSTRSSPLNSLQLILLDVKPDKQELQDLQLTTEQQAVEAAFMMVSKGGDALQEDLAQHLCTELSSDKSRENMNRELRRLTQTVLSTKENFLNVEMTLRSFDSQDLKKNKSDGSSGGEPIEKLAPKWSVFRERFNELVADSRQTARDGHGIAHVFIHKILDLAKDEDTREDAIKEIDGYLEHVTELEEKAAKFGFQFEKLHDQVSGFQETMKIAIGQAFPNLNKAIEETEAEIEMLKAQLKAWSVTSAIGFSSLSLGFAGGGIIAGGVALGLMAMTPLAWIAAICAALVAVGGLTAAVLAQIEKSKTQQELQTAEKKLEDLHKQKDELYAIAIQFKIAASQIDHIAKSLKIISCIWDVFAQDAGQLKTVLESATKARTQSGLKRDINMLETSYQILETNLELYATGIERLEEGK